MIGSLERKLIMELLSASTIPMGPIKDSSGPRNMMEAFSQGIHFTKIGFRANGHPVSTQELFPNRFGTAATQQ